MIDLIEQSNLYRLIAIAVTLFSFWQIARLFSSSATLDAGFLPFTPELSRVVIATVLGGLLFPIIIALIPGQVGGRLYSIFSFGNPSSLVWVGLVVGAVFGVIYQQLVDRLMLAVAGAIGMAMVIGLTAFFAGAVFGVIESPGEWGAILDQALSWGWIGAKGGAALGLVMGAFGYMQ
jgi:hypothetical protein